MGRLLGKSLSKEVIFDLRIRREGLVKVRETHILGRKKKCTDWKIVSKDLV